MEGRTLTRLGLRVPSKAGREDTRATNLRLVLQHLFRGDPVSRADIARSTDLTPATVSALIAELDRDGLVEEVGMRRDGAQVGKPPTMLSVRAAARNVVALDLSDPVTFRAAVVDLDGEIGARVEVATVAATGTKAVERVQELAARAIAQADSPILGIGVGTPGVVTPSGVVVEASTLG